MVCGLFVDMVTDLNMTFFVNININNILMLLLNICVDLKIICVDLKMCNCRTKVQNKESVIF